MITRKINNLSIEAYKILIDLLQNDENLFWKRNEFMLAINGGMISLMGIIFSLKKDPNSINLNMISITMGIIGIIISLLWFLIACRSESFYNLWYDQLKYIENNHIKLPKKIFQTADDYFDKRFKLKENKRSFFEFCTFHF